MALVLSDRSTYILLFFRFVLFTISATLINSTRELLTYPNDILFLLPDIVVLDGKPADRYIERYRKPLEFFRKNTEFPDYMLIL